MKVDGPGSNWFTQPLVGGLNRPKGGADKPVKVDDFVESAPPQAISKPQPAVKAASSEGTKKSLGLGKKLSLVVAAVLGAGILAGGVVATHDALVSKTPPVQVQLTQREAQRVSENFNYLDQVGHSSGGGLKTDPHLWSHKLTHHQPDVNPSQAFAALVGGQTVYFYPGAESQSIPVHSADELRSLTREVKTEVTKAQFAQGARAFQEGLKNVGERIQEGINDVFHH